MLFLVKVIIGLVGVVVFSVKVIEVEGGLILFVLLVFVMVMV